MQEYKPAMNCKEFHEQLPSLMDSGRSVEDEPHLRNCENCRLLVQDLRYIADQAKLLLPMHDPSPRVWTNIQESLSREGLSTEGRLPGHGQIINFHRQNSLVAMGLAVGMAAVVAIAIGLFQDSSLRHPSASSPVAYRGHADSEFDPDDTQLLTQVEQRSPALRDIYANSLRQVNAYIADARSMLDQNPEEARAYLREAYAQKAMLYHMAAARSIQDQR
jgi:hypothetical protein